MSMMNASKYALSPTTDHVLDAESAGFASIDHGQGFWYGFENRLEELGYQRIVEAPCSCPDAGWHGHMPECRWLRDWPA